MDPSITGAVFDSTYSNYLYLPALLEHLAKGKPFVGMLPGIPELVPRREKIIW